MKLENKIALITGGARGIGKAIAEVLAKEGAKIVISDININGVEELEKKVKNLGRKFMVIKSDVSDSKQVYEMINKIMNNFGRIDILINNAGGSLGTPYLLEEITEKMWDKVINVNLKGTFLCSKCVAKFMKERRSGKIVNVSSAAGKYGAEVAGPQYVTAKAGVLGFTRQLAKELGPYRINVNAIAPGLVFTERVEKMWKARKTKEELEKVIKRIPFRRVSTLEEQANVVAFLCSDEASYITGVTIDVNGGWYMS